MSKIVNDSYSIWITPRGLFILTMVLTTSIIVLMAIIGFRTGILEQIALSIGIFILTISVLNLAKRVFTILVDYPTTYAHIKLKSDIEISAAGEGIKIGNAEIEITNEKILKKLIAEIDKLKEEK